MSKPYHKYEKNEHNFSYFQIFEDKAPTQTCSAAPAWIAKIDDMYTAQKQKMNSEN